ncbi:MAG: cell division/cell wall cluster transcriptional repressor MraZ [Planctomycetota bacterium]|nr:cell division/cell wall cluster transcriptional repressor MraZ [Planctomycetota bacterium]
MGGAAVFHGESVHTLDTKFRLVVPKRISDHLGRGDEGQQICVLTRGQDRCIYLFSKEGFERAMSSLRLAAFDGEEPRAVRRVFLASTFELELDGSGRVLVPEKLRPQLGDERELAVIGNHDHAEIWGKQAWDQYQARNEGLLDRIDRILGGQGGAT